jgi:hypothetical protein
MKRHIDRFDLEAEREGNAVRTHNGNVCKPFGTGRRIIKQRRMHGDANAAIERRTVKQSFEKIAYA